MNKFFALVRRALQTETRLARSHLARCFLGGFVLWTLITTQFQMFFRGAPGLDLFRSVTYYNFFFITILGTAFFATSITEEKEERTLGLLKMAGVGAPTLILGKWTPRMIGAFFLLSIQIPFTVLAITLGGVLWNQIGAAYLSLFGHLFLVGNIGLLCSVVMSTTTGACGVATLILVVYHFLPMVLQGIFRNSQGTILGDIVLSFSGKLGEMNGFGSIGRTMTTGFSSSWWSFQLLSNLILGTVILLIAGGVFDLCTRNEKEEGTLNVFDRIRKRSAALSNRRVWQSAILWKDFHFVGGGAWFLGLKLFLYLTSIFLFTLGLAPSSNRFYEHLGGALFGWSAFFIVLEIGIMSARLYRSELSQKTWSSLVLLPRSSTEIIYSKLLGGLSVTLPLLCCMFLSLILIPDEFADFLGEVFSDSSFFLGFSYFISQIVLAFHISTYLSITQKWAHWPIAVFLSGFILFMANMMIGGCLFWGGSSGISEEPVFFMGCLLSGALILFIHLRTRTRLIALAAE